MKMFSLIKQGVFSCLLLFFDTLGVVSCAFYGLALFATLAPMRICSAKDLTNQWYVDVMDDKDSLNIKPSLIQALIGKNAIYHYVSQLQAVKNCGRWLDAMKRLSTDSGYQVVDCKDFGMTLAKHRGGDGAPTEARAICPGRR